MNGDNFNAINVSFIPFFVFGFWSILANVVTKILCNLSLHFARQDGQERQMGH